MRTQGLIMPVEGGATLGFGPSFELAGCGEQRSDDFVAQDEQSTVRVNKPEIQTLRSM
jgi:hypothetical protein